MLVLVRIHVPYKIHDPDRKITTTLNPDYIWDYIAKNHQKWRSDDIKLLYMTKRDLHEDTSLIIDAKSQDALADFLIKNISTIEHVRDLWIGNMMKFRVFKLPHERARNFARFTVTIDALPKNYRDIYETISSFRPSRDIVINYVMYMFHGSEADIMVSVLARSKSHMEAFVSNYIKPLKGVMNTKITRITKTMRLVSPEEWKESIGPHFRTRRGVRIRDVDIFDDSFIASC